MTTVSSLSAMTVPLNVARIVMTGAYRDRNDPHPLRTGRFRTKFAWLPHSFGTGDTTVGLETLKSNAAPPALGAPESVGKPKRRANGHNRPRGPFVGTPSTLRRGARPHRGPGRTPQPRGPDGAVDARRQPD